MTDPTPTPEKQNPPASSESEETPPNPADEKTSPRITGFFHRVQRVLSESEAVHPSEAKEIVIMPGDD